MAVIDHLVMGGAEMLLGQFAAAAPSANIKLSVACLGERDGNPAAAPLRAAGIVPTNLDVPGRPGARTFRTLRRHLAAATPDIVHTHLGTSDWVGGLTARSLGLPVVSSIHTAVWGHDLETRFKRTMVRLCAARIIAVSDSARGVYAQRGWSSDSQLVTIHNGVDVEPLPGAGREVRAEFGWGPEHLVVGMVSALRPEKGHDLALEAMALLRPSFPGLRLLIVGHGPAREQIASRARELSDFVAMAGARADVMRCFDAFDICLHPSRADAFPTTLLEAMAASVPIVATAVGGIPEIVTDGETGMLMPAPPSAPAIADAVASLLRDRPRREALASAARVAYAERFTAGPWVHRTRELYDEVLDEAKLRGAGRARGVRAGAGGR